MDRLVNRIIYYIISLTICFQIFIFKYVYMYGYVHVNISAFRPEVSGVPRAGVTAWYG